MNEKRNLAARAGRWSAQHRKKAIFGWLVFVILAVFIGGSFGTKTLTDDSHGIGESGRADKVTARPLPDKAAECVLVQSQERRRDRTTRPSGRGGGRDALGWTPRRASRTSRAPTPPATQGQLSPDGRSALVTFDLPGRRRHRGLVSTVRWPP